jgi:cyclopropane fatty-acyl-phospholipid synthase-like methyltransferase
MKKFEAKNKGGGKGFELLTKNTNEYGSKGVLMQALKKFALKDINPKSKLLDIGTGSGNLTVTLSKRFSNIVIIEPGRKFFNSVCAFIKCRGFNKKWEKVNVGNEKFDLVLAIHVFYYIAKRDWHRQISRMINALSDNGKLVIVLQSKKSHLYAFANQFLKKESNINSEELIKILRKQRTKLTSHILTTKLWANNEREAKILGNFLLDAHNVPKNDSRALSLWGNKKNKFYATNREQLIIVSKM